MKDWQQVLVGPRTTLREALEVIDRTGSQMALVVDAERRLLGTLSDGDIRRSLLRGLGLADAVAGAMHTTPVVAHAAEGRAAILATMRRRGLHQMPVLDAERHVVGLETFGDFFDTRRRDNWVVIMAGGLGTRLGELTRDTPKPMLRVGTRPLLETIVRHVAQQGFERIYIAVNYKAEQIEAHFGDGTALGVDIRYLREDRRLGTAGALALLPERPTLPVIVANADLLTKEDFGHMIERHVESGADATMAVRPYEMQVPFGVVRERDGLIDAIDEKPLQRYVVSAGIYVLGPQVLDLVQAGRPLDMPSLFEALIARGQRARCHHVRSYWLDIGQAPDYEQANVDFDEVFR
jgi:dTDP-glucose pyrophosphorylase